MTVNAVPRPGFDAELRAGLAVVGGMFPPTITPELIDFMRLSYASPPMNDLFRQHRIDLTDVVLPGYQGGDLTAAVLRPRDAQGPRPTVLYAHSGGLMFGDRFNALAMNLDWVEQLGAALELPPVPAAAAEIRRVGRVRRRRALGPRTAARGDDRRVLHDPVRRRRRHPHRRVLHARADRAGGERGDRDRQSNGLAFNRSH